MYLGPIPIGWQNFSEIEFRENYTVRFEVAWGSPPLDLTRARQTTIYGTFPISGVGGRGLVLLLYMRS